MHLHTQYNRDIPWSEIDMDFMNLNQAAHGDREFGFIGSRMRLNRKVVVGHWQDEEVLASSAPGCGPPAPGTTCRARKVARFGDNMREVAVTEGDKVEAQIRLGYSVNGYGVGDLVKSSTRSRTPRSTRWWPNTTSSTPSAHRCKRAATSTPSLREAARIELGMRAFLEGRRFQGLHHHL